MYGALADVQYLRDLGDGRLMLIAQDDGELKFLAQRLHGFSRSLVSLVQSDSDFRMLGVGPSDLKAASSR
jgi:hypothetical protein